MVRATLLAGLAAIAAIAQAACSGTAPSTAPAKPAAAAPALAAAAAGSASPASPASPAEGSASAGGAASAAATGPLDHDLPRLVERSLAMYRDIAQALATSGEDCAAATPKLGALAGRYNDVVIANAKVLQDGRAPQLRKALAVHSDEFDRLAQAITQSAAMAHCVRDPDFAKAFDSLLEPPP